MTEFLLVQNTDAPLLTECACGSAAILGENVVALVHEDGDHTGLCPECSREMAPALSACAEALNALAVAMPDLPQVHKLAVVGAMVQQISVLCGPTVALLNVNPNLIERINNP